VDVFIETCSLGRGAELAGHAPDWGPTAPVIITTPLRVGVSNVISQVLSEGVTLEIAQIDDLPLLNTDLEERVEGGAR